MPQAYLGWQTVLCCKLTEPCTFSQLVYHAGSNYWRTHVRMQHLLEPSSRCHLACCILLQKLSQVTSMVPGTCLQASLQARVHLLAPLLILP